MSILRSKHFSQAHQILLYINPTNSLSQTQKLPFTNPYYPFSNLSKIQNKHSKLNPDKEREMRKWGKGVSDLTRNPYDGAGGGDLPPHHTPQPQPHPHTHAHSHHQH